VTHFSVAIADVGVASGSPRCAAQGDGTNP
jgi:hypothetical protein